MSNNFKMNLDHFKKIKEDERSTTLRHTKDNHEIKIAHKALSEQQRHKLSKLEMHYDGGIAGEEDKPFFSFDDKTEKTKTNPSNRPYYETEEDYKKRIEENKKALAQEKIEDIKPVEGVAPVESITPTEMKPPSTEAPPAPSSMTGPMVADTGNKISGNILAQQTQPPSDMTLAPQAGLAAQEPIMSQDYAATQMGGMNEQIQGIQQAGQAQVKLGQEQAAIQKEHEIELQQKASAYEQANNALTQERARMQKDVEEGHIDPSRFIHNMSTGGKISSALGLILGGMGAGLTHGPNLAYNFLQKQIDEDIDAQKSDMGKKENLLKHNYDQTHDLRQAYDMTRLQMNDMLIAKLGQAAATASSEMGKAQAMQLMGIVHGKSGELQHSLAIQQMQMGGAGGGQDPAKLVALLVPKEHQAKAFGEIEAAENTRHMGQSILKSFEDAAKENTAMKTGAGLLRTPGSVYALHQAMQPTFKDLEGTVRQAAMDNTFKNITPAPGDSEYTIQQKRSALNEYLKSKMSAPTARAYGIDLNKFQGTRPFQPVNKQQSGTQYEQKIINGKAYMVPKK